MAFLKIFVLFILLLFIAGFAYFSVTDVPIRQNEVTTTLPASHFKK